jgi:hypothetical protein
MRPRCHDTIAQRALRLSEIPMGAFEVYTAALICHKTHQEAKSCLENCVDAANYLFPWGGLDGRESRSRKLMDPPGGASVQQGAYRQHISWVKTLAPFAPCAVRRADPGPILRLKKGK